MPILQRPQQTGTTNVVQIGAGNAATSATHIAQVTDRLGGSVAALGKEYLQKSQQALSTAVYDLHMQKATEEFNQLAEERMSKTVDEEGNPNFATLPQDIERIGNQVMMKRLGTMFDPNASSQFTRDFRNFTSSQSVKAAGVARQQELDYTTAAVKSSASATINKAIKGDITEVEGSLTDFKRSMDSYLASGTITKEYYDTMLDSTRATIYKAKWGELIDQDADTAVEQLSQEEALGLTQVERLGMLTQAKAKVKDNEKERKAIETEHRTNTARESARAYTYWDIGLTEGKQGLSDLNSLYNNGVIQPEEYLKGVKRYQKYTETTQNKLEMKEQVAILTSPSNPQEIPPSLSGTANEMFKNEVALTEKGNQSPMTYEQLAGIAKSFKTPLSYMTDLLTQATVTGGIQGKGDAVNAYNYLVTNNPLAISKLPDSVRTMYEKARLMSSNGAMSGSESLKKLIEIEQKSKAPDADTVVKALNAKIKDGKIKDSNIEEYINDKLESKGDLPFFGFNKSIDPGLMARINEEVRNIAINNRSTDIDIKALVGTAVDKIDHLGYNEVGANKKIMELAPAKVLGVDSDTISTKLDRDIKTWIDVDPDLKGLTSDNVFLFSTPDTLPKEGEADNFTWDAWFMNENGELHELPFVFSVNKQELLQIEQDDAIAKGERDLAISQSMLAHTRIVEGEGGAQKEIAMNKAMRKAQEIVREGVDKVKKDKRASNITNEAFGPLSTARIIFDRLMNNED